MKSALDVLCVGLAAFDLVFCVDHHPGEDEKAVASSFSCWGGGPAANAAIAVARLGGTAAFCGYLGNDIYGDKHLEELKAVGIDTRDVVRGASPTPVVAILVKPDGRRTVAFYRDANPVAQEHLGSISLNPRVILFDGHEPDISLELAVQAKQRGAMTVLDAGSLRRGTQELVHLVDYVVSSERFAREFTGETSPEKAVEKMHEAAANVVITLGEKGLVWCNNLGSGSLAAYSVNAVDTTGAGDAFHGAFAVGLALGKNWEELLRFASAAGAFCCTKFGGRPGMPATAELTEFICGHQYV
jgi:sulfofructose kinase